MKRIERVPVICGVRGGKNKFFWALNLYDWRVYIRSITKGYNTIAEEVDDFCGYPVFQGKTKIVWEFRNIDDDKFSQQVVDKLNEKMEGYYA